MRRDTGGGQGQTPLLVRDVRHLPAGPVALPPTGSGGEAAGGIGRWHADEMVVMMFGYGGGWPAWELALMWVGMIAFVGLLVWAVCALAVNATRKPGRDR